MFCNMGRKTQREAIFLAIFKRDPDTSNGLSCKHIPVQWSFDNISLFCVSAWVYWGVPQNRRQLAKDKTGLTYTLLLFKTTLQNERTKCIHSLWTKGELVFSSTIKGSLLIYSLFCCKVGQFFGSLKFGEDIGI